MAKFDSKTFNPEAFGKYVERIPNVKRNQLAQSGAVGSNENARSALSSQTGSLYATIPYFGRISGDTSQNNTGAADITSTSTTTYEQGFVTASRMDSWTERSFSKNITAGVDFMDNVAKQISEYKVEVQQAMLLAILKGVFSMATTGNTVPAKAAKEFIEKHTYDISGNSGDAALVGAATLNTAIQQACGDNKNRCGPGGRGYDANGVQQDLTLASWNGRTVLIDDEMPVENVAASGSGETAVAAHTKYTSYVLGQGSIILDNIGDSVPYEMSRDPKTNGGQDTLFVRDRYICGVDGISFIKPASLTASASNSDLETGTNWNVINDGTKAIPHKAIALARIISQG